MKLISCNFVVNFIYLGEREKRKDQLLDLQKSKQERTDSELQNLRQVCSVFLEYVFNVVFTVYTVVGKLHVC